MTYDLRVIGAESLCVRAGLPVLIRHSIADSHRVRGGRPKGGRVPDSGGSSVGGRHAWARQRGWS